MGREECIVETKVSRHFLEDGGYHTSGKMLSTMNGLPCMGQESLRGQRVPCNCDPEKHEIEEERLSGT
jgi:hypothetical protein